MRIPREPGCPTLVPAVLVTGGAVAAINVVGGYAIARLVGFRGVDIAPVVPLGALVVGLMLTLLAVRLWRRYYARARVLQARPLPDDAETG